MATVDDPERFRSSKDIGPWLGLTQRREQSGERAEDQADGMDAGRGAVPLIARLMGDIRRPLSRQNLRGRTSR
ncbi:MAG: IS110 family transposase [Alphaproteobacteria bacterium]|nr:IS110 family transposase [Alphaproteobacteria bacterium]